MSPNQIAAIDAFFRRYNNAPLPAFSGIAPAQMHELLYDPWAAASPLQLRRELPAEVLDQLPFFRLTEELLGIVQRDRFIKLTALGALPGKYLHELYGFGWLKERGIEAGYVKLHREIDVPGISTVHLTAVMAGLLRKVHGRLTLTKNGERLRQPAHRPELLRRVLSCFTEKFNWAYHDNYDSELVGQFGWGFTAYLLLKFGDQPRPLPFYADQYQQAFPHLLDDLPGTPWNTPAEQLLSCYGHRTFGHFTQWFGLATIEESRLGRNTAECLVTPTPLLRQVFAFS